MSKKIWGNLKKAGQVAAKKHDDQRDYWVGAVAERSDGVLVVSANGPAMEKTPAVHAERRLSAKIDHGATVYVARIRLTNGEFANAKPCKACMVALKSKSVDKIYYTVGPNQYKVINSGDM